MLATVAQFAATTDKAANLKAAADLVATAAARGSDLVVLPENSMYTNPDPLADVSGDAEAVDGPFATAIAALAKEYGIAVVAGMTEAAADGSGKPSNTVLAVDRAGEQFGVYRKVHLYDAFGYRESDRIQAQPAKALTFTLDGLTVGVMTCYDLRFPEMARFLVDAGAEAVVVPAAWVAGPVKEDHWTTLLRARAIENTVYVLGCGQTGPVSCGQSAIVDPMGQIAASAGETPGVASAVLESARVAEVRAKNPSLANRRFSVTFD
ncbi:carbon-nitrogen hydrolase family protein [Streptomyces sp. WMMC500]|uniref:carbon-nitrogen hydrolase family protein n=1 Tax=Streptomyces sp. WMMC500 TaxID=3015154 RepID=UPI00248C26CF|nr:carbon-nitrogen hydrolase family protein [Streptomyces sp. WMMC500]WBB57744.1 carbon-nitrogen hydrolase family protein [Streptomyces sp. WMMC500]